MEKCGICGATMAQIVGIIGAVLLIIGCFLPLYSVSLMGQTLLSVTFLTVGFAIYGWALIIIALLAIVLLALKKCQEAQGVGAATLLMLLVFISMGMSGMNDIKNIAIIGKLATDSISYGYAWIILFAGTILMIIAPYTDYRGKNKE